MPQVLKPEVRARILEAALAAFARGGFAGATMGDIAREAGVAVANLYRYSASKEELSAFGQRFVERLVALSIAEIRAAHAGVVVSREARLVLQQIFENTRRMIAVLLESCTDDAAIRRAVAAFRSYQVAGLAAFASGLAGHAGGR